MTFRIRWEHPSNALGLDDTVAVLQDEDNWLEVWPALGFNAYRWQVDGEDLLYRHPQFFQEKKPTRTGFPILYPFPNRIRDGRFTWDGKTYQLPLNDPTQKNAIHGFAVARSWRIVEQGADASSAWITGEFHGSVDAPETHALWPADYRLRITYRLSDHILGIEATADNPDTRPLPFGLGYHPYFALAPFGGKQAVLTVGAQKYWELAESLPTGRVLDVDARLDFHSGRRIEAVQLDDVLTGLHPFATDPQGRLNLVATVQHPDGHYLLTMWADPAYRDLVLFTPPHREAIAVEPYTCTTDAINLSQNGIDAGVRVLQPGERWQAALELHFTS
jgi:aldose 1-epimerase